MPTTISGSSRSMIRTSAADVLSVRRILRMGIIQAVLIVSPRPRQRDYAMRNFERSRTLASVIRTNYLYFGTPLGKRVRNARAPQKVA